MKRVYAVVVVALSAVMALGATARPGLGAEPGLLVPNTSEASDMRRGNVLFYNLVASSLTDPTDDTRLTITNHSDNSANFIRLYFVDGGTGLVASTFICLTATQTSSFQASDLLPGFRGFMVAVAVDGVLGCPMGHSAGNTNLLSGQAHVKSGIFQGTLPAIAAAAQFSGSLPGCDANSVTANMLFNGVDGSGYNRLPRTLQVDNIASAVDGQTALVVLNRPTGDLIGGTTAIGSIVGTLFNDMGTGFAFNRNSGASQLFRQLDNRFPLTSPKFRQVISSGRIGWLKFNNTSDVPLLGSVFYRFAGAANLRARTLSASGGLVVPVDGPSC